MADGRAVSCGRSGIRRIHRRIPRRRCADMGPHRGQRGGVLHDVHRRSRRRALRHQFHPLGQRIGRTVGGAVRPANDLVPLVRVHSHRAPPAFERRRERSGHLRLPWAGVAAAVSVGIARRVLRRLSDPQVTSSPEGGGRRNLGVRDHFGDRIDRRVDVGPLLDAGRRLRHPATDRGCRLGVVVRLDATPRPGGHPTQRPLPGDPEPASAWSGSTRR
ncbi:hypothetical protein MAUB1S_04326 [Mycolicibacterium aubagnense]